MSLYAYVLVMALTTYLIRVLPLTVFRKPIHSRFVKSFLYYIPYAVLGVMTIPAIFYATASTLSALIGFLVAVVLAWMEKGLLTVAASACGAVLVVEIVLHAMGIL